MKHRNPLGVIFFSIITFGIYAIVWNVKTKNEMNKLGAEIPTAWLIIIPIVNIYWVWKYSKGVEHVTGGKTSGVLAFVLLYILSIIGMAIVQDIFNGLPVAEAVATPGSSPAPAAPVAPDAAPDQAQPITPTAAPAEPPAQAQPDNSFGGPAPDASPAPPPPSVAPETPPETPSEPTEPPAAEPPAPPQVP
jgi:hypothetical protein